MDRMTCEGPAPQRARAGRRWRAAQAVVLALAVPALAEAQAARPSDDDRVPGDAPQDVTAPASGAEGVVEAATATIARSSTAASRPPRRYDVAALRALVEQERADRRAYRIGALITGGVISASTIIVGATRPADTIGSETLIVTGAVVGLWTVLAQGLTLRPMIDVGERFEVLVAREGSEDAALDALEREWAEAARAVGERRVQVGAVTLGLGAAAAIAGTGLVLGVDGGSRSGGALVVGGALTAFAGLANLMFRSDEEMAYAVFAAARALTVAPVPGGVHVGVGGSF
jgi:hypothetical protein